MMKRVAGLGAALCLTACVLAPTAEAASYLPRYTGSSGSIAVALEAVQADPSYASRARIAAANGIEGYRGTAGQNVRLLELLKAGTLIDPTRPEAEGPYLPTYTGSSPSIAAALASLGVEPGFAYRSQIAAANGISGYSGTAAQNTRLLELLRQGRLIAPGRSAAGPIHTNLSRVSFLRQDRDTCKATSAAMAVDLLLGGDRYSTADMIDSGALCRSLEGEVYVGSDGNRYRTTYKTDRYVGSLGELTDAVDAALDAGVPIVAAVHSAASRHHWIVILGRDGQGGYLAVDPAGRGSGTLADQVRSMSAMGYSFGLADYAQPHYGYISFHRI